MSNKKQRHNKYHECERCGVVMLPPIKNKVRHKEIDDTGNWLSVWREKPKKKKGKTWGEEVGLVKI